MFRFLLLSLLAFLTTTSSYSQKLSGQWTGGFTSSTNPGSRTDYVLELEISGDNVSGYSYTYFNLGAKRCFTICKLSGSYDKGSKSLVVKEVEKIKGNTPPDFHDCLQIHSLTYLKGDGKEILSGKWKQAREKDNCGAGKTELERKELVKILPQQEKPSLVGKSAPLVKTEKPAISKASPKPVPAETPNLVKTDPSTNSAPDIAKNNPNANTKPQIKEKEPVVEKPKTPKLTYNDERFIKRNKQIIKTIEVDSKSFKVELYDNGQIDGDTVSVYLNGRLMVSNQRLSTTPISLTISLDDDEEQELVMYAENLGTIPPNTALMVVTVGDKRYEVNITSSEQTNGAVRFIRK